MSEYYNHLDKNGGVSESCSVQPIQNAAIRQFAPSPYGEGWGEENLNSTILCFTPPHPALSRKGGCRKR
jgi:hypothetical protein